MTKGMMKALTSKARPAPPEGCSDLLLRFFQSQFFNEWIAIQYLYTSTQPGVHDYLCNKLLDLSEAAVDSYLLQLIYLAVSKPGGSLERTLVELASRSFRLALKMSWLLLALLQDTAATDRVRLRQLEGFKEQVERAALEGKYDVPFRTGLGSISPVMSPLTSGVLSPTNYPLPDGGSVGLLEGQQLAAAVSQGRLLGATQAQGGMTSPPPPPPLPPPPPQVQSQPPLSPPGCSQGQGQGRIQGQGQNQDQDQDQGQGQGQGQGQVRGQVPWQGQGQAQELGQVPPSRLSQAGVGLQIDLNCLHSPQARDLLIEPLGPASGLPDGPGERASSSGDRSLSQRQQQQQQQQQRHQSQSQHSVALVGVSPFVQPSQQRAGTGGRSS